jgi:hypothetical protein
MYCKKCGSKLDADSVFCSSCGTRVNDDNYAEEEVNIDIKNIFNNADFFNSMNSFGGSQRHTLLASKGLNQSSNRRLKIETSYAFIKSFLREKNYGVFIGTPFMLKMRAKLSRDKQDLANRFASEAYIREIKMALALQKKEKELGYEKFIQLALNNVRVASNIGYTAEYLFAHKDRFK